MAYIIAEVKKEYRYIHAQNIVEFDSMTLCPNAGQAREMDTLHTISNHVFKVRKTKRFIEALEAVYEEIDEADPLERVLILNLYRSYQHNKNITVQLNNRIDKLKRGVYLAWVDSREKNDASDYVAMLDELIKKRKEKYELYERLPDEEGLSTYELMLGEFEEGITKKELDELFKTAAKGVKKLLKEIGEKDQEFRTGFLGRDVVHTHQHEMAKFIMETMGFDFKRGTLTEAKYPIMSIVSPEDIRLTARDCFNNFIHEMYFIVHACGLALLEQLQPQEDIDAQIFELKSKGMKEGVAFFYENIIGKSRAFIHVIYPKVCDVYPRVMRDVSETELYEVINMVEPSLIRLKADEVTGVLHGLIRYEMEKEIIDGDMPSADIRSEWNAKYKKYLGITPETDIEGVLQDMHWSRDFGILPMYPLGCFYGSMILKRIREDMDPFEEVAQGNFYKINDWMKEHVFKNANRLSPKDWIYEICHKPLTAKDYLSYLNEKYRALYNLDEDNEHVKQVLAYANRTERIRKLSSPGLSQLETPDEYLSLLSNNFKKIGELSRQNKEFINKYITPVLESKESLSEEVRNYIEIFYRSLISQDSTKTLDIPIVFCLVDRTLEDAKLQKDDKYYIEQLDKQIENAYHMVNQTRHITVCPEIASEYRVKGLKAYAELMKYLEKDAFKKLDDDSRVLVLINSRFGAALNEFTRGERGWEEGLNDRIEMLERSIELAHDPFYTGLMPDYNWDGHLYKCYEYLLQSEAIEVNSEAAKKLLKYADLIEQIRKDKADNVLSLAPPEFVEMLVAYERYKGGEVSRKEHLEKMLETCNNAKKTYLDSRGSIVENVTSAACYVEAAADGPITEEIAGNIHSMYRTMISYAFHMPKFGVFSSNMAAFSDIITGFMELPGGISFMQMGLNLMAAIHPPTYIHSVMVAKIATCLTKHIIEHHPELFVGCQGCNTKDEVVESKETFLSFVYNAGLCHDFGKLVIIDTVYVYGRNLLPMEQEIITSHAAMGAELLSRHESTKDYVNVAAGHHRWYDGTKGYPESFDIINSPCRTSTSIVCCADCMDTATDKIGRSYNDGIELEDYIKEVKEGAGTRYAPYMAEILERPEVARDMKYLLTEGRKKVYRDTYRLLSRVHVDARF